MIEFVEENVKHTVGDLIDALSKIPRNTTIYPFGSSSVSLAYDKDKYIAYLDETDWIDDKMENEKG